MLRPAQPMDYTLGELWQRVLDTMKFRWGTLEDDCLVQARPVRFGNGVLVLECADDVARNWMVFRYDAELREILAELTGRPWQLQLVLARGATKSPEANMAIRSAATVAGAVGTRPNKGPRADSGSAALKSGLPEIAAVDDTDESMTPGNTVARIAPGQGTFPNLVVSNASDMAAQPIKQEESGRRRSPSVRQTPNFEHLVASNLNPRYTFDTFVVGQSNHFAHAASLAVALEPAKVYNPLFIYGDVGLGKTHLMQAIAHYVLTRNNGTRVAYVTSETFTNDLINAIQTHSTAEFRAKYRSVDILLIDDIQFIAGKESTQVEFFHTFNVLYEANKQIVITSDRPPREIQALEERLRSRFQWGLPADIQPPDIETRVAILREKARREYLDIPSEVFLSIANRVQSNIRDLEGALNRVVAHATLHKVPITEDVVDKALRAVFPHTAPKTITAEMIQQVVAEHFGVRLADMRAKKRSRAVAFPRQIAMYLTRELTSLSLPKIGEDFGGRDHSTVIHACEKIREMCAEDPALASTIRDLTERLQRGTR